MARPRLIYAKGREARSKSGWCIGSCITTRTKPSKWSAWKLSLFCIETWVERNLNRLTEVIYSRSRVCDSVGSYTLASWGRRWTIWGTKYASVFSLSWVEQSIVDHNVYWLRNSKTGWPQRSDGFNLALICLIYNSAVAWNGDMVLQLLCAP